MNKPDYDFSIKYFPIDQNPTSKDVTAACNISLGMNPIQSETVPQTSPEERCVILCLDQSGSMAGSNFESLKSGAIQVGERAFTGQICTSIYTIFYHKNAEMMKHDSIVGLRKYVNLQSAGGMTNFSDVYEKIQKVLSSRKKAGVKTRDLSVIFFTDGNDTSNPKSAVSKIPELKQKIISAMDNQGESQFFAIGFTSDHDASLLNKLVKIGSQTGGFFFIPSNTVNKGATIKEYLNDCWTLMGGRQIQLKVNLNIPSINYSTQVHLKTESVGGNEDTAHEDDDDLNAKKDKQKISEEVKDLQGKNLVIIPNNDQDDDADCKSPQKIINVDAVIQQQQQQQQQDQKELDQEEEKKENSIRMQYQSSIFVSIPTEFLSSTEPLVVNLQIDGQHVESVLTLIEPSNLDLVRKTLDYINLRVFQCISEVQESKDHKLEKVAGDLEGFDQRLNQIISDAFKVRGPMRKECITDSQVIKGRIREAVQILRQNTLKNTRFSNEQIAKLNDLAYRGVHHKGLQKKLDTRALKNQPYFEKIEKEVQDIVTKYNFLDLRKKYETIIQKIGCCPLTVLDTIQSMQDRDCMCISLKISRPEAAVADPTKLIIRDVISTYMSANAFLDSACFNMEKNQMSHGGFDINSDIKLSEGVGRQSIGGVLPLFLFQEHWNLAKRYCPKVFGLMCTADVMGFSMTQYYVVPFLVLAKLVELQVQDKNQTEARQMQFDLVLETCIAIIRQKKEVRQEYEESITKFLKDPLGRTVDSVSSIRVLMGRLLTLNRIGTMQLTEEEKKRFFQFAFEQEMRRMLKKNADVPQRKQLLTMLYPDWAQLIDGFINQEFSLFSGKGASEEQKMSAQIQMLVNQKNKKSEEVKEVVEKEEGKGKEEQKNQKTENGPKTTSNDIQIQKRVNQKPWLKELEREKSDLVALFKSGLKTIKHKLVWLDGFYKILGIPGDFQIKDTPQQRHILTAMFLQNTLHPKNSTRREAIEKQQYIEILTAQDADKFYKTQLTELLQEELRTRYNEMFSSLKSNSLQADSMKFAATQDVYLAAGLLKGKTWGGNLTPFYEKLQTNACPSAYVKIQMLLQGSFEGIILICDKGKRNPDKKAIQWNPNKVNKKKFWKQNVYESKTMTQEDFMKLFPSAMRLARKMWLINMEKVYHREADKIAFDEFPEPKKEKKGKKK